MDRISKELMGASSIPIILSILVNGDSYGYEIMQTVKRLSDGRIKWKEGSIYPVLKKMEANKLIRSDWKFDKNNRPRKYYTIQNSGKKQLKLKMDEWKHMLNIFNELWGMQTSST